MSNTDNSSPKLAALMLAALFATNAQAQTAKYNDAYTIQGFSQPNRISQVASPIAGIIRRLQVREGDRVREGDLLVQLDRSVHNERLEIARVGKESLGELQNAEAELAGKKTRLGRVQKLADRNHATPIELLQANEDLAIAKTSIQRAKDRLNQQEADYNRLLAESEQYSIKAPFDGVVVEFGKQVGEYVGQADAIVCTVAELDTLSVEFLLPRRYRQRFTVGDSVQVLFTVSEETVPGVIDYISPFPNGETNTFTVKTRVDNSSNLLYAGERCQLQLNSTDAMEQVSAQPNGSSESTKVSMRGH